MSLAILKSRWFVTILSVLLALLMIFFGKELRRKYEISQEIKKIEQEISALESKNTELLELANYFKTSEYKERQARALLGLQKPGEFAVALPGSDVAATSIELNGEDGQSSNLKKWWKYFFGS